MKDHETPEHLPFDATRSALDAVTSAVSMVISTLGTTILVHEVSSDIGDCSVGITMQMCKKITNL